MQQLTSTRKFMITNPNMNSIIKPNLEVGQPNINENISNDTFFKLTSGKINHQMSIIFDIIYDRMYRLFNENKDTGFINSSLVYMLDSDIAKKHYYFEKLLTTLKLDFYNQVVKLIEIISKNKENKEDPFQLYYNDKTFEFLDKAGEDIIENAFGPRFPFMYRNLLNAAKQSGNPFNELITFLNSAKFHVNFFIYILKCIFDSRTSMVTDRINIPLHDIFENDERSVYNIKNWFANAQNVKFDISYPIKCFYDTLESSQTVPKKLFFRNVIFPLFNIDPINGLEYDKSTMSLSISLRNHFMVFYAHDAKMCIHRYIPSSLYKMNSNAFFIGKGILNSTYYDSKIKGYKNKLNYKFKDLLDMLNLPLKDITNNNNAHRRKAVTKAIELLEGDGIISVDIYNTERLVLNKVWNILETC